MKTYTLIGVALGLSLSASSFAQNAIEKINELEEMRTATCNCVMAYCSTPMTEPGKMATCAIALAARFGKLSNTEFLTACENRGITKKDAHIKYCNNDSV